MALKFPDQKFQFGGQLGGKALLALLLVVSLVLVIVYSREDEGGPLHSLQSTTSAVSSPLSSVGASVGSLAASAGTSVEDLTASDASLSQTRENNATLSQMVVELEEYRQEAQRLESLLGLSDAYGFKSVAARVVAYSADSYNKIITLDAGSNSGVKAGLPVMGSTGVIGQVISVTPVSCQVRLITDAQSGVSVMLQSSRAEGILAGSVDGTLTLDGIDETVDVKEGDAVITSGIGGGYYRGLVVGTVSKVTQAQGDATRTIVVTPNANFDNVAEALIVISMDKDATSDSSLVKKVDPSALSKASSPDSKSSASSKADSADSADSSDGSSSAEGSGSDSSDAGSN
ncbi:MAG: rod shape-determining protein MreC [Coriobacteriia bacterium]|nr:rod shape-determining protein MreC [Coriobacteriia bacterium]